VRVGCLIASIAACGNQTQTVASVEPQIIDEAVEPNPNSTISAIFTVHTLRAQAVRIELTGDSDGPRVTQDVPTVDDAVRVPLLGLYADTDYRFRAIATSEPGVEAAGQWIPFRSGSLPSSITSFDIVGSGDMQPGVTLLVPRPNGPTPHPAVIIDRSGRVVWYREVSSSLVDFQLQPNGHLTGAVAGAYQEWDGLGNVVRAWTVSSPFLTDVHEVRLLDDGSALLFGFETRSLDLSRFDGPAGAGVIGNVLQRIRADGAVSFQWNTFEHYALDDADDFVWQEPGTGGYDFTHCNAIETLPSGDYLVSTRNLSEITRIDHETGEIRWRMGKGKGNQFTFINDPKGGFWNMHGIRRLQDGHLIMIDNGLGHMPPSSRAVEYEIDEDAMTATLVWSFEPGLVSCCMGFAQRLANGNTLVTLGEDYRVSEVSPAGDVVWEARLPMGGTGFIGFYRASRIGSLDELR
jgi:hypothetical protein